MDALNQDYGLGLCLQCLAEFKLAGADPDRLRNDVWFACTQAPMQGMPMMGPTCYKHLNVQAPLSPGQLAEMQARQRAAQQPPSPAEQKAVNRILAHPPGRHTR